MAACEGIDVRFSCRGGLGIGGSHEKYYSANTEGTLQVLMACRTQGVSRLIYTSSPSVRVCGRDQCGVDESAPYGLDVAT